MTVPKVACTTIKRTLRAWEGLPELVDYGVLHEDDQHPRLSSLSEEETLVALRSAHWLRFAIVRNPYDRLLSAWKSKIANPNDIQYAELRGDIRTVAGYPDAVAERPPTVAFGDFVRFILDSDDPEVTNDGHWNLQVNVLLTELIAYDVIGRFESFAEDFTAILRSLDAPEQVRAIAVEVTNATARLPLAAAFDRRLAAEVFRYYRADFEAFGYAKDSWMIV